MSFPMRTLAALAVLLLLATTVVPSAAAQNPVYGLDDRVFPEPMQATSFLQWADFVSGLEALHAAYPDFLEVFVIGESIEGRPIYFVEVTNEKSATPRDDKLQIGYSASIHANEAAGREGMVRVIEDLASGTGALGDLQGKLDHIIINIWFPNPDSWASGDWFTVDPTRIFEGPPSFYRTNVAGVDLNREFPNPGLIEADHTPMSEPESKSVVKELRYSGRHTNLVAGTDLHGMINSPNMMRAIIPNQDMDFHRMMHAVRFLKDLEDRVNNDPHFVEWNTLADALCMVPDPGTDAAHEHAHEALPQAVQDAMDAVSDDDGIWTLEEAQAARALMAEAEDCGTVASGPTGGVGHGKPFLWGARWDQIGYTDSGFTSDYLMLSPRSPTGGMGAVGTITEFAYSHMVPNNHYVPKLNDMHVAGVRETVRTQIEYTLLLEEPRLVGIGPTAYVENPARVTSASDPNAYKSSTGKPFSLADESTWFDFDQVDYDVANTDFWRDLGKYTDDPVDPLVPGTVTTAALGTYDNLVLSDIVIDALSDAEVAAIKSWVEAGGNLILTDKALSWFDRAGLTTGAAYEKDVYLGHSNLETRDHPLLAGVDWNARQTAEGPPTGYRWGTFPQWHLKDAALSGLTVDVAGRTNDDPTLGTATLGTGTVHFIGAALPQPSQEHDHRYGLAPYSVTALTYYVFVNGLGGQTEWQPRDTPFVPFYPDDPLYGAQTAQLEAEHREEEVPAPAFVLTALALLAAVMAALKRRR